MSDRVPHAARTEISIHRAGAQRMGFFTDTTVCIGCKACEVACKQWNDLPSDGANFRRGGSYDHTSSLSATTWRHVRFVEMFEPSTVAREEAARALVNGAGGALPVIPAVSRGDRPSNGGAGSPTPGAGSPTPGAGSPNGDGELDLVGMALTGESVDVAAAVADMGRWIFMSDVCKHCTNAGCMDACPTGALIRTEFETVVLQPDVCNGCGYCIPSCPFGVVDRSPDDGRASKCTLCYDRLEDGLEPACAKACPTDSIQFGPYEELVDVASRRVATLHDRGMERAYLYGAGDAPEDQLAGGLGAFFLLTEPPERYGLPAEADSPIQENVIAATLAAMTAAAVAAVSVGVLVHRTAPRTRSIGRLAQVAIAAALCDGASELLHRARH